MFVQASRSGVILSQNSMPGRTRSAFGFVRLPANGRLISSPASLSLWLGLYNGQKWQALKPTHTQAAFCSNCNRARNRLFACLLFFPLAAVAAVAGVKCPFAISQSEHCWNPFGSETAVWLVIARKVLRSAEQTCLVPVVRAAR